MFMEPDHDAPKIDLAGRSALVTGAGSGIGRAIALTLAQSGAAVTVNDILADRAEETVALIAQAGGQAVVNVADIADEQSAADMVAAALGQWGKLDILCNNAGIMDRIELVEDVSTELWNRVFAVNVTGQFFVTRAVLPHMRAARRGAIVNTVSDAGLRGGAAGAAYVASKHALAGLTKSAPAWSWHCASAAPAPRRSPTRRCSWLRIRHTTSTGSCCRSMVAGWRADRPAFPLGKRG